MVPVGLVVLLAIVLLLLAVPLVPLDVDLEARLDAEGLRGRARIAWLFGLVRKEVRGKGARKTPREEPGPQQPRRSARILPMLRTEGFLRECLRLARRAWGAVRVRELSLRARLGLDDPASTGRLMGALSPLVVLLSLPPGAQVELTPEFTQATADIHARSRARVWPYPALAAALRFLLARPTWRALRARRRTA